MRSPLAACAAAALLALATAAPACADDDGFATLFDGESLDGWVRQGGDAVYEVDADAPGGPEIVGTSVADTPNSFLCTAHEYADFVLEFEVKIDPALNSGVQFRSAVNDTPTEVRTTNAAGVTRSQTMPAGRVYGYQVEVDPSARAWSGGIYDEARRGWLVPLDQPEHADARAAFDPDGWNHYRVEAVGDRITTHVNGVPAAELTDDASPSGFIALQVHSVGSPEQAGKQVRWRNLRIKPLASP